MFNSVKNMTLPLFIPPLGIPDIRDARASKVPPDTNKLNEQYKKFNEKGGLGYESVGNYFLILDEINDKLPPEIKKDYGDIFELTNDQFTELSFSIPISSGGYVYAKSAGDTHNAFIENLYTNINMSSRLELPIKGKEAIKQNREKVLVPYIIMRRMINFYETIKFANNSRELIEKYRYTLGKMLMILVFLKDQIKFSSDK